MSSRHPDLATEQGYFDDAFEARERMRAKAEGHHAFGAMASPKQGQAFSAHTSAYVESLGPIDEAVAYGRFDTDEGERYYIGRHVIWGKDQGVLVVSWKAEVAARWYQATTEDPLGLTLRRSFETASNRILDIFDVTFARDDEPSAPVGRDALLRALAETRTGHLRDVVETIERTQDGVMRSPLDRLMVIQGGPGTGKTIVGLQRISLLLFQERERLTSDRVLFVGPNISFMRYVERVLPGLGDEGVPQSAVHALSPLRVRRLARDDTGVGRVKGDPRMVELIRRAVQDRIRPPDGPNELRMVNRTIRIEPDEVSRVIAEVVSAGQPYATGRNAIRDRLAAVVEGKLEAVGLAEEVGHRIRPDPGFQNLLDRIWPQLTGQQLLRDLLASERRLEVLSSGLFTTEESARLFRPQQQRLTDEPWTAADLALIDELDTVINGMEGRKTYDFIVVDEAQDLTPMELRMVARRSRTGYYTILGDLAQATGVWAHQTWEELFEYLQVDGVESQIVELELGYRVPAEIMEVAAPVAAATGVSVRIPRPVRPVGEEPAFDRVDPAELTRTAVQETKAHLSKGRSVGILVSRGTFQQVTSALDYERIQWSDGREFIGPGVTVLPAEDAKGLEFDAVVLVEPSAIVEDSVNGLQLLYVALTRTTQALSVIHARDLPACLAAWDGGGADDDQVEMASLSEASSDSVDEPGPEAESQEEHSEGLADQVIRLVVHRFEQELREALPAHQWPEVLRELRRRLELD